jgi:hypothetical protein
MAIVEILLQNQKRKFLTHRAHDVSKVCGEYLRQPIKALLKAIEWE